MEIDIEPAHRIRTVAVLGAGTMGSQIALHVANAGLPCRILDLTEKDAKDGLARGLKLKPSPIFTPDVVDLVSFGGFDAGLDKIAEADWIVEAVVERPDVKTALLARVDGARRAGSMVSSNTSGIPIGSLAAGRSDDFQRHFLGTHFFNPPRYMHLVEVIPTAATDESALRAIVHFCDHRLGKGVVIALDRPNFIANHIGLYSACRMLDQLASGRYSVAEIDAMTGPLLGRPKSATFRTIDLSGLDVLAAVAHNLSHTLETDADRRAFRLPPFVLEMIARGWLGEKSGQGFYRRERAAEGRAQIQALDPANMEYRPAEAAPLDGIERFAAIAEPNDRVRALFADPGRVGEFTRATLGPTLVYTSRVALDIARSTGDVDRAMRWGFGWELGPFELMDAIGSDVVGPEHPVRQMTPPPVDARTSSAPVPNPDRGLLILKAAKDRGAVVSRNASASLIDLGDAVLALEFHSKLNTIGPDTLQMVTSGLERMTTDFAALVIGNEAPHFSAGANLAELLGAIHDGRWNDIDGMVRRFQATVLSLRYADGPVIVAANGLTLGGGCELMLHADRVQAAAETYAGLVETGVGLIPAGCGTKEMLVRCTEADPASATDLTRPARRAFETIGFARTSTSARDGRALGFFRDVDRVTMNRERVMDEAKALALLRVREGYVRPAPRAVQVGGEDVAAALDLGVHLARRAGRISDHDALIGRKLAWILAGGSLPHSSRVSEAYMLDLEREAFLSLCGESKTHARIAYTLKTGNPLRN